MSGDTSPTGRLFSRSCPEVVISLDVPLGFGLGTGAAWHNPPNCLKLSSKQAQAPLPQEDYTTVPSRTLGADMERQLSSNL